MSSLSFGCRWTVRFKYRLWGLIGGFVFIGKGRVVFYFGGFGLVINVFGVGMFFDFFGVLG